MNKLNKKNKIFVSIFILIILAIILILIYAIKLSSSDNSEPYLVTNNVAVFASDTSLIDTSDGGKIEKKWNGEYYYSSSSNRSYSLGTNPVVYDRLNDILTVMGVSYQVQSNGNVTTNQNDVNIEDFSESSFYKLADRVYLVVSNEIYNNDKSIYANKYLIINIDKQGNASVYNDSINIKTVNPMLLNFGNYTFDIANEKLIVGSTTIDLKSIIGSTNEYVFQEKTETETVVDTNELTDSYNQLVNDFEQYTKNANLAISAASQVSSNNIVVNGNTSGDATSNKTSINKRVSLRGTTSHSSYIDVSYIITDPENSYQAVYLLVTGEIEGQSTTQKIILDKYATTTRINYLTPNSEYTISLGYIEVITTDGNKTLNDAIEDIINIRTTTVDYSLEIEKIANGSVYFNFKMTDEYAFESGKIVLYIDGVKEGEVSLNYDDMISTNGFSDKLSLKPGQIYELRIEDAIYNEKIVNYDISKKFTLS